MSVKHVNAYYAQICAQYKEMLQDIKDFEQEALDGIIEPERVERLKDQIAPLKQNYERWSYMMFLLHQPNRPSKIKGYAKRNKKFLESLSTSNNLDNVLAENESCRRAIGE